MVFEQPRVLFIDSYDSFTYNLASLCRAAIPNCIIHIIKNDDYTIDRLLPFLPYFTAIIVGPGPGSPDDPADIGVVKDLWKVGDDQLIPIFGVCLGLQSLGIAFGATLHRLKVVKHGQVSTIQHGRTDLFHGIDSIGAVRYHSLHVKVPEGTDLEELAYADDGEDNGKVVMALKHRTKPFWAVQYHPESVCTEGGGFEVIFNFWQFAQSWSAMNDRHTRAWDSKARQTFGHPWPYIPPHSLPPSPDRHRPQVLTSIVDAPGISVTDICERFGALEKDTPFVLLDSAAKPGRFSIIGCLLPTTLQILHNVGDRFVTVKQGSSLEYEDLGSRDVWSWIASFMRLHKASGCPEIPFWGGLVGTLSYELGVQGLQVQPKARAPEDCSKHPDVNLVLVERSIVLDLQTGKAYIQSLLPADDQWVAATAAQVLTISSTPATPFVPSKKPQGAIVTLPNKAGYIRSIEKAKEHLFAGDSYEICFTAPTSISLPLQNKPMSTWERYKLLRKNNPAPHSAYLRLQPTTFLASSPERFLSYTRPPHSLCQLRPIKGTVRKAPGITREVAEELLAGSTKEVAENLMIVDLIRHDLHGVVGEDVQVTQFCKVEEYETVWQLVSVIEGRAAQGSSADLDPDGEVGWEVLRRSLPPGSMTGAPKKRSVEILQNLESKERGLYSGVFGYWCVGGGGDWSVTIRSCFKYDSPDGPDPSAQTEEWKIGAGGAITALSDSEAEWEEMVVKLQSVLKTFA